MRVFFPSSEPFTYMNSMMEIITKRRNILQLTFPEKIHIPVDLNPFRTPSTLLPWGLFLPCLWTSQVTVTFTSRLCNMVQQNFLLGLMFKMLCSCTESLISACSLLINQKIPETS